MNIAKILGAQVALRPDAVAIIDTYRGKERRHSFASLADDAARAAAVLRQQGVGKGDRVLIFQPMSYELYVALLATFQVGAVAMFLDPSVGTAHINQCCDIGGPTTLIASARAHLLRIVSANLRRIPRKFSFGRFVPGAISIQHAASLAQLPEIAVCDADDPALLTFTSGSTGLPKAALRTHGFLLAQHRALERALALRPGEVDLTTLPVFLLANLASGLTSVIPDVDLRFPGRIRAGPVVEQIVRIGVTRSAGSPAFFRRLVEFCESDERTLGPMSRIDTGGAPVFPGLLARLQQLAPEARVVSVYGSTEAEPMTHMAFGEMGDKDLEAMRSGKGLLVGLPVSEVALCVLPDRFGSPIGPYARRDFEAEVLPVGAIGEIVVSGGHVLQGYLDGRGDIETKFEVDGRRWHRTGDAGYIDEDHRLWLVGRCAARISDDRGLVYPFMVECAAQFVEGVRRSALVAHAGERILLVESDRPLESASVRNSLAWAALDEVRVVRQIPVDKRHNAKVDYTRVHELLG